MKHRILLSLFVGSLLVLFTTSCGKGADEQGNAVVNGNGNGKGKAKGKGNGKGKGNKKDSADSGSLANPLLAAQMANGK